MSTEMKQFAYHDGHVVLRLVGSSNSNLFTGILILPLTTDVASLTTHNCCSGKNSGNPSSSTQNDCFITQNDQ